MLLILVPNMVRRDMLTLLWLQLPECVAPAQWQPAAEQWISTSTKKSCKQCHKLLLVGSVAIQALHAITAADFPQEAAAAAGAACSAAVTAMDLLQSRHVWCQYDACTLHGMPCTLRQLAGGEQPALVDGRTQCNAPCSIHTCDMPAKSDHPCYLCVPCNGWRVQGAFV